MNNLPDLEYNYYFFGSSDSHDTDVLIEHPDSTSRDIDDKIVAKIKENYPEIKNWDINIIKIENGIITYSIPSKGLPDSVHNSLFDTYKFHKQKYKFPLTQRVNRNIENTINVCLNKIFIFYKNGLQKEYYKNIPKGVKNGEAIIEEQLEHLKDFDFQFRPFEDNKKTLDFYKSITFRIGQTISLIENVEIYTKDNFKQQHPDLSDIIDRKMLVNYSILNTFKNKLFDSIKTYYNLP